MKTFAFVRSFRPIVVLFQLTWALCLMQCKPAPQTMFKLLPATSTGIDFTNTITETDSFNILTDEYIYNGGGVAVADFNNDGLQDLFFTGNEVPNRLYRNKGALEFEDVSEKANISIPGRWNSGVVVVDINNDGWKDLYVCATMKKDSADRQNMLFVNKSANANGGIVFEEMASAYGIADNGYSSMAAFFDYDRDGDLDLYIVTNQQLTGAPSNYREKINNGTSPNNDRLYRNNGNNSFTNVSKEAGIIFEGYGLGIAISDFNLDGWQDIYVSNDFLSEDILYLNNQNGTFTNKTAGTIAHQSHSSMGNDAADFDNDGLPDIVTLDMLPETNSRKKTTINNKTYLTYINNERFGYEYQYVRNMLHRNNGTAGEIGFSEIGQLSGIHQTEWSWSPLFADFDNDGWKDLLITNGFPKDITDKDFSNYRADVGAYVNDGYLIDSIPVVKIPNYAYRNQGDLTFQDVTKTWGLDQPSFSNGAAFSDLDNDGDLDYIVNNINSEAFVYENTLSQHGKDVSHYLRIKLKGNSPNIQAIGAKVMLYRDHGKLLFAEQSVARGYLSSVEDILHFGVGKSTLIDSIRVIWPDGKTQRLENVKVDQVLEIAYPAHAIVFPFEQKSELAPFFHNASKELNLQYKHVEEDKIDYNIQRTLPHKFTQSGPSISVGDVNGDKLDDIIIGGSSRSPLTIFTQNAKGTFSKSELSKSESNIQETAGMLLFDADGDDDLDLYVVSGSIENDPGSPFYQDQFFRNDGKGKFALDLQALPEIKASGSCVRAADFDGDNDLDLFVGGRVVPGAYPLPAESFLLRNDKGKFSNATNQLCPELSAPGMITDALFTDFDNDGKIDLVTVGEFMDITFFKGSTEKFSKVSGTGLEEFSGWWNSIAGGDFDNDGDVDYVAGNLGTNNGYQITKEFPLKVFAKDYDKNGSIDAILGCYIKESRGDNGEKKLYPIHFWDELNSQSPKFRQQFSRFKQYGSTTMENLLSEDDLKDALLLKANYFESSYIENLGNGKFKIEPLPKLMQVAPINGLVVEDVNDDGNLDLIMVGNDFGNEVFVGRYDAFTGAVVFGNGKGSFELLPALKSGFKVTGDAKSLAKAYLHQGQEILLATQNIDSLKVFMKNDLGSQKEALLSLLPFDSWAELIHADGKKSRLEFYYGSGYLSQSTRKIKVPANVKEIIIHSYNGQTRTIPGTVAKL